MSALTYADAGVNLSAWHEMKKHIGELVRSTYTPGVVGGFGQFGGLFDISFAKEFESPVLVTSVDGVGTKLRIAIETGKHQSVGEDIVNHCVDDILVMGAKPLYFLDYFGTGRLAPDVAAEVIAGLAKACRENGVALIGGETAEMPGFYADGEYDLAGTIVGVVDKMRVVDGSAIGGGDILIGLRSNGLHTNGYSLARKIVTEVGGKSYGDVFEPTGRTFGQELLRPHRSFLPMLDLILSGRIKGCAHITGGGFQENIDRILPTGINARIDTKAWTPEPVFQWLQKTGEVENNEMYRTFNMGIGMVAAVDCTNADSVLSDPTLAAFDPVVVGKTEPGDGSVVMEFA